MTHNISRRTFLKTGAVVAASTVLTGCEQYNRYVSLEPYVRPPEQQPSGDATWYASTCRQCPAGCGIIVRVMNGRAVKIEGNPEHPLNHGKLCARGQAGLQLLYNPDRLLGPLTQARRQEHLLGDMPWDQAIAMLSDKLKAAGSGVAIWLPLGISGHLYDLFARFAKAIGAPAPLVFDLHTGLSGAQALLDTSNRLFGRPAMPVYDLAQADVVFSFGADFLGTWLSPVRFGVDYGRFRSQSLGKRGRLVQFEARQSITGAKADDWFFIRPGTEGLVAQAIARIIADGNFGAGERSARAQAVAGTVDIKSVAAAADISVADLTQMASLFAMADHPLAIPGGALAGINGGESMTAVQMLNVIAGNLGQPGGLSLTPDSPAGSVVRPPVSTFADLQHLLDNMRGGQVQALWLYDVNPVYELPAKLGLMDALAKVPFVATSASVLTETAMESNLVLAERTYLESWGYDVVSPILDLPVVGGQQPVVSAAADARSAGDVLLAVAKNIPAAASALTWPDEVAFLKETIAGLPPGATGGGGADVQWARFLQHGGWWPVQAPAAGRAYGGRGRCTQPRTCCPARQRRRLPICRRGVRVHPVGRRQRGQPAMAAGLA